MPVRIDKLKYDDDEYLPELEETPLWEALDPDKGFKSKKADRQLAGLYKAIADRENYFQENTPTAFGNPDYSKLCGVVCGYLFAMELNEVRSEDHIIIYKNNKPILIVDRLVRPYGYYQSLRENREVLEDLGF